MPDKALTPAQLLAAQAKNYGTYVAVAPIYVDGALAYNPGHAVSALSVEDGTVDKSLVKKVAADVNPAADLTAPIDPTQKKG